MNWLGRVITEHYSGNNAKAQTLLAGVSAAFAGISVEEFEALPGAFLRSARHPSLGRGYLDTAYGRSRKPAGRGHARDCGPSPRSSP